MVGGLHRDGDVRNLSVDGVLCIGQGFVGVDDLAVSLVRREVIGAVLGDEPSKPLTHVQDAELRPQIHQTVRSGRAGQPDDTADFRSDLQQRLETLCLVILEGGQLIDHHHIEVKGNTAFIYEPSDVFPVDDVDVSVSHQCRPALGFCSDSHGADEVL